MSSRNESGREIVYGPPALKRSIGVWGSFCMGYADVGADIYIALGIITVFAAAASPIAFGLAAIAYVCTGLCYAELGSTYPVAGGAQVFSFRAFGGLLGFLAGWGLMLGYTVCITFFALAATGYLGFFYPILHKNPYYGLTSIALIISLTAINLLGIRLSSALNEFIVAVNLVSGSLILVAGFIFAFNLDLWLSQIKFGVEPTWNSLIYATSLAMASYIGIESISQAAEETKDPRKVIPKATIAAVVAVPAFALGFSTLSVGILPWRRIAENVENPLVYVASQVFSRFSPSASSLAALWVAFLGFSICYVSSNTGLIGVSRVTFSMARLRLLPPELSVIHPKYRTPFLALIAFSSIACLLILINIALPSAMMLEVIADTYNFGALVAYMLVNLSLIALRNKDKNGERPWKVPLSKSIGSFELPILPVIGFATCLFLWAVMITWHEKGRLFGSLWFMIGLLFYVIFAKLKKR
jgi:APA family basic amino acid/polyamine antiporter